MDSPFNIKIEKVIYGGNGLGHHEGKVVFVPFTLPNEEVSVVCQKSKKNFSVAKMLRILSASPERSDPLCEHFTKCGGCQFQHIKYPKQLEIKKQILIENLKRFIAKENISVEGSNLDPWYYREHIKLSYQDEKLGFHGLEDKDVIDIHMCPIFAKRLHPLLIALKQALKSAQTQKSDVRILKSGLDFVLAIHIECENIEPIYALQNHFKGLSVIHQGKREDFGDITLKHNFLDLTFTMDAWSFMQNHHEMAEKLYSQAVNLIEVTEKQIVDLYCGVGISSILISKKFPKSTVTAIEINPHAVEKANLNKMSHGASNVTFHAASAEKLEKLCPKNIDQFLVNPPREGLSEKVLESILKIAPKKVIYISCNPTTLARDLNKFIIAGYEVVFAKGFDLFPQTTHLETLCEIKKR
jgi:23S rRNA (uracil1939-C5)-methyltransferase